MEPTVRIFVTPSSTRLPPETPGAVVVSGSHAAIFTVYLSARAGARAAIQHDAGIGLDQAGVSGGRRVTEGVTMIRTVDSICSPFADLALTT